MMTHPLIGESLTDIPGQGAARSPRQPPAESIVKSREDGRNNLYAVNREMSHYVKTLEVVMLYERYRSLPFSLIESRAYERRPSRLLRYTAEDIVKATGDKLQST